MSTIEADVQDTDVEWEKWGARDPYFGVLTHERYRSSNITPDDYLAFFESGRGHVEALLTSCRRYFGERYHPRRALDFGCGVGRVLLPLTEVCEEVVGVDISESMLAEARRNCARFGVTNGTLVRADDQLSGVEGCFDLIHSTIVFQHINPERGLNLIARLVEHVEPGGIVSIHVTYGRNYGECHYGRPAPPLAQPVRPRSWRRRALSGLRALLCRDTHRTRAGNPSTDVAGDPQMMMYHYDLSRLSYIFYTAGADELFVEFTDHGGELGATLYARICARTSDESGSIDRTLSQSIN